MTVEQIKQRMMDSLPSYYHESPEVDAIMHGNAFELQKRRDEADDLLNQFFVTTATWGLALWERELALPPLPRATLEFRRQRILTRLNGAAPATKAYLEQLVDVYMKIKDTQIVEYNSEYRFEVEMNATNAIDMKAVIDAIEEVKPAHLAFSLSAVVRDEKIILTGKARRFGVPYPITNQFSTASMDGKRLKANGVLDCRVRDFVAPFPITNVMQAGTQYVREIKTEKVGLHTRSEILYATYPRCGEVIL